MSRRPQVTIQYEIEELSNEGTERSLEGEAKRLVLQIESVSAE